MEYNPEYNFVNTLVFIISFEDLFNTFIIDEVIND